MDLLFSTLEVVAVILAVLVARMVAEDGESNWLEGAMLLMVYAILGVAFFYLPGQGRASRGRARPPAAGHGPGSAEARRRPRSAGLGAARRRGPATVRRPTRTIWAIISRACGLGLGEGASPSWSRRRHVETSVTPMKPKIASR